MPVRKVKGGYRWGSTGKVYKTKREAKKQGFAIQESMKRKCKRHNQTNCLDYKCCGGSYGKQI